MTEEITALSSTTDGGFVLESPAVGTFTPIRRDGQLVEPGDQIGSLRILSRELAVVVPKGVSGRLGYGLREKAVPVAYGTHLFAVAPSEVAGTHSENDDSTAEGGTVVRAQMDGQFYQRPSPEEPAFVSVGQRIEPGTKIGLIEVMKFFYPVIFEGSEPATITALVAADAAPVEAGDALIALE